MGNGKRLTVLKARAAIAAFAFAMCGGGHAAMSADEAPAGRSIAYVFYDIQWAITQTKDTKAECPNGLNQWGPRERFKAQFPADGTKRTFVDTQLSNEAEIWFPTEKSDQFEYRLAGGKVAPGLNLDGQVKPTDFTSPDGKPGVDNQLFRVIGCIVNYRDGASIQHFDQSNLRRLEFDRLMIEVTDVDSLANDDDVTITTYRGRDPLVTDATGNNFQPGGTQRLDLRWGKSFIHQAKGKIVNGVLLSTQPMSDFILPRESAYEEATFERLRDARFELKLTPDHADGIIGGYADIESWYRARNRSWGTHHESYGQQPQAAVYRELRKLADGFPDPKTGRNTAISAAYEVKMVQVRVIRPGKDIALNGITPAKGPGGIYE